MTLKACGDTEVKPPAREAHERQAPDIQLHSHMWLCDAPDLLVTNYSHHCQRRSLFEALAALSGCTQLNEYDFRSPIDLKRLWGQAS